MSLMGSLRPERLRTGCGVAVGEPQDGPADLEGTMLAG